MKAAAGIGHLDLRGLLRAAAAPRGHKLQPARLLTQPLTVARCCRTLPKMGGAWQEGTAC
jgi:hypothetical protein